MAIGWHEMEAGGPSDPHDPWPQRCSRVASALEAYLQAQGVAHPRDAVRPTLLAAAQGLDAPFASARAFRVRAFTLAHHAVVHARRGLRRRRIVGSLLLLPLGRKERDLLLLRLIGGLPAKDVGSIMRMRTRRVLHLEHRALVTLALRTAGGAPDHHPVHIADEDVAALIAGEAPEDRRLLTLAAALERVRAPSAVNAGGDEHRATVEGVRMELSQSQLA